ncbi:MAG: SUMF1/EgtB/PvdO family nonheme iron enzyme [Dolichospermum sp. DEX182a]|nr:SUMF1/EgtB/PvdO family nonheme iron enzyme [Dolichospermum sp. DEX182a]
MSLCINPNCPKPQNPNNILFCENCSSGLLLQDRYRVIVRLGGGGFGDTFEINEVRTNKTKVIKILTDNRQKAIELFKQEADVLSQLHHPGIPKVEPDAYFEHYPHNNKTPIYCLVMEKIEGENLQNYMQKNGLRPINQTTAIAWLKDLLIILEQVHNKNFFHRDIKPSNIMLRAENAQLVLIDFGTVRKLTTTVVNQQGGVTGIISAGFTPSEQINNNAVPQSDFFALGRTFVYLLTGKEPLDPIIYDAYNEKLDWRNHAPQISSMLADLLDEMMQRLYKDRPGNTQEILQRIAEIEKALQPIQTTFVPPPVTKSSQPQKTKSTRRIFLKSASLIFGTFTIAVVGQKLFSQNKNQISTPKIIIPSSNLQTFNFEVVTTDATGNIINRRNASAKYFTEDLGNGVFLEMVEIPGGTFIMGSPASEAGRSNHESPQHQVTVPSFYMGKYELTQAQYQVIMGANPAYSKGDNRPVERVSWNNAVEFCKKLSQKTGKKYRLPSEAEWEYACRAGTTTPFYFGESITPDLVNYDGNHTYAAAPKGKYRQQTTDVGTFPPNAFGLYDMHGNVWEWCEDDWQENYINAPINGSALISRSDIKLLRGGSWDNNPEHCRSACRGYYALDDDDDHIGFRVVCSGAART